MEGNTCPMLFNGFTLEPEGVFAGLEAFGGVSLWNPMGIRLAERWCFARERGNIFMTRRRPDLVPRQPDSRTPAGVTSSPQTRKRRAAVLSCFVRGSAGAGAFLTPPS